MAKKIVIEIISALLVLLFVYAAISKLLDYSHFARFINRIPIIAPFSKQIAWIIPASELIICGLLAKRTKRLWGMYASFFLMFCFTAYLAIILNFSTKLPCHCGGILQWMSWKQHIVFNIVFLLLSLIGIKMQLRENRSNYQIEKLVQLQ